MVKYGFIIVAHKEANQLKRLVDRLDSPKVVFFIHIDRNADIAEFKNIVDGANIVWVKRERAQWGSIGMVQAILNALLVSEKVPSLERLTLLSGADYPIKPLNEIFSVFEKHPKREYFDIVSFDDSGWSEAKKKRIKKHYFFFRERLFEYPQNENGKSLFRNILNTTLSLFLSKERTFPGGIVPYGGFVWFSFTTGLVKSILEYHKNRSDLFRFCKKSLSSDEVFFHTIIGNLNPKLENVYPSLTYTDWESGDVPHPNIITQNHLGELCDSKCLFARKFDPSIDSKIIDVLDAKNMM